MRVRIELLRTAVYLLFASLLAALWTIVGMLVGLLAPTGPWRTALFATVSLVGTAWSGWSAQPVIDDRFQTWIDPDR